MSVSDYDRWFISTNGTDTAILCKREKFIDHLKDVFGAKKAAVMRPQFRKANFFEQCRLEIELKLKEK